MRARTPQGLLALVLALVVSVAATACTSSDPPEAERASTTTVPGEPGEAGDEDAVTVEGGIRIEVLSSQPDRATGPDTRIRVTPDSGGTPETLVVTLDGRDVTASLEEVDGALEGVVVGLVEGNNTIRAHDRSDPAAEAIQRVRSWPLTGPMISGPQRPLLACSTEAHGLGAPSDANCSAPTRVRWKYVNTAGEVLDLPDPAARPADVAEVTDPTGDGEQTLPFVLRHETGVLNRSIYDIVTVDPTPGGSDADQSDAAWNRRLIYRFGPGCAATHGQGASLADVNDTDLLREGYAIATATFNAGGVQCNDVVSAETAMMVKERFVELFGLPDHTIGLGASGGAIQIHLVAQNYPGVIDGGVGVETFPDFVTLMGPVTDCQLLVRWFSGPTGSGLTPDQRAAVAGTPTAETCGNWSEALGPIADPVAACDPAIPADQLYHPESNPTGLRCTYQDAAINVFGADPATGHARRPLDNVGIQYGLDALNEGTITFDQFTALNREIGGLDGDGGFQELRHEADPEAVALAYETGRVSAGAGDQRKIPIIAIDMWSDPSGDVHDHVRPFSLRDRLTFGRSPEAAPGFQIWTRDPTTTPPGAAGGNPGDPIDEAVTVVDRWLTAIDSDDTSGSRDDVLDRNRPSEAIDNCVVPGRAEPVSGIHVYDEESECSERFVPSEDPRMAAGAPRSNDVVKCSLKAVDPDDYERSLTDDEYQQLLEIFPTGVCDWEMPGVGQTSPSMSDRTFEDVITPEQMA